MKNGSKGILIAVYGVAAAIFALKGLLNILVQDFPVLGCLYLVIAGFFAVGLIWSIVQLVKGKRES